MPYPPPPIDGSLPVNFTHLRQPQLVEDAAVELAVGDTVVERETFRDHLELLKDDLKDNPREVKRLVNLHRLVKIILQVKQQSLYQDEEQRKLVRWLLFCANWPDLIDDCEVMAKKSPNSPDILAALIEKLDRNIALSSPEEELIKFAKSDDPLSAKDVNDFKEAARMSTLIRESVVAP